MGFSRSKVHETEVKEVREWFVSTQKHLEAALGEGVDASEAEAILSPVLGMSPLNINKAGFCYLCGGVRPMERRQF